MTQIEEDDRYLANHARQRVRASFVLWRAFGFAMNAKAEDFPKEWLEKAELAIRDSGFALVELPDKPNWPTDEDEEEFDRFVSMLRREGRALLDPL